MPTGGDEYFCKFVNGIVVGHAGNIITDRALHAVKAELATHRVCLINVMGSPGAGKTTTLISLIDRLRDRYRIGI